MIKYNLNSFSGLFTSAFFGLLLFFLIALIPACGGSDTDSSNSDPRMDPSETPDRIPESTEHSPAELVSGPQNMSIKINGNDETTSSVEVKLFLQASDDKGIVAYRVSEDAETPDANSLGWVSYPSTKDFSIVIPHTFSADSINKKVYTWFKDEEGNISEAISDTIDFSWQVLSVSAQINSESRDGYFNSMVIDSTDNIRIANIEESTYTLSHIIKENDLWFNEPIFASQTQGVGQVRLVTDSNDISHLAFHIFERNIFGKFDHTVKYANKLNGSWDVTELDTDSISPTLAVDSNNKIHMAYRKNNRLAYATNQTGNWQPIIIDSTPDTGTYAKLMIDSNDKIHIIYRDENNLNLKYVNNVNGPWSISLVANDVDGGIDAVIDSNDQVHAIYRRENGFDFKTLYYAKNFSGNWVLSIIQEGFRTGQYTSIALDDQTIAHVSFLDSSQGAKLIYATNAEGPFANSVIDTEASFNPTSIALDSNQVPHISYGKIIKHSRQLGHAFYTE